MGLEYKQMRYRAAEGKFDGNLNTMAQDGWEVVHIDRDDDIFLVTFSRARTPLMKVDTCGESNLEEVLGRNIAYGNVLKEFVGARAHDHIGFLYTLVWEVTRPGTKQTTFSMGVGN